MVCWGLWVVCWQLSVALSLSFQLYASALPSFPTSHLLIFKFVPRPSPFAISAFRLPTSEFHYLPTSHLQIRPSSLVLRLLFSHLHYVLTVFIPAFHIPHSHNSQFKQFPPSHLLNFPASIFKASQLPIFKFVPHPSSFVPRISLFPHSAFLPPNSNKSPFPVHLSLCASVADSNPFNSI